MEEVKGKLIEDIITSDKDFQLENLQNIYFKNFGEKNVMIGQYLLRPDQETYIHTGNITLESKSLEIVFTDGMGIKQELYVRYIKVPECTCD